MRRFLLAGGIALGLLLAPAASQAAGTVANTVTIGGTLPPFASPPAVTVGGTLPAFASPPAVTNTPTPTTAASSITAVTAGVTSAQALAGQSRSYLYIQNVSQSAYVACAFAATAALNTAGSFMLAPLGSRTFEESFVPNDALNCIATAASTPVTVEQH